MVTLSDHIAEQAKTLIIKGSLKTPLNLPAEKILVDRCGISRPSFVSPTE